MKSRLDILIAHTQPYRTAGWQGAVDPPPGAPEEMEKFYRQTVETLEAAGIIVTQAYSDRPVPGAWAFSIYSPAANAVSAMTGYPSYIESVLPKVVEDLGATGPALQEIRRWIASEKGLN